MTPAEVLPAVGATLACAAVATALGALPGLAVAVYVSELCPPAWQPRVARVLEVGAALPGVVFGYAAVRLLPALGVRHADVLVTGAVLGVMVLPTAALLSLAALRGAPESLREAGEALGASDWQTAWGIVVPSRGRSLAAAVATGFARAAGETVAVLLLAARLGGPRTLTARLIDALPTPWNQPLLATSLVLLALSTGVALLSRPAGGSSAPAEASSPL